MGCGSSQVVLMDRRQIMAWIVRRLGAPRFKMEFAECNLEDAVEDAIQWFVAWRGSKATHKTVMLSGEVVYPYPDDAVRIVDVIPPGPSINNGLGGPDHGGSGAFPFLTGGIGGGYTPFGAFSSAMNNGGVLSGVAQGEQYREMAARTLSRDFNWWTDKGARTIHISPVPSYTGPMHIQYITNCFNLSGLDPRDHMFLKRYALAIGKDILGHLRRKYSEVPTAEGKVQLDGQQLIDEAKEEMTELDEQIQKSGFPYPVVTG